MIDWRTVALYAAWAAMSLGAGFVYGWVGFVIVDLIEGR